MALLGLGHHGGESAHGSHGHGSHGHDVSTHVGTHHGGAHHATHHGDAHASHSHHGNHHGHNDVGREFLSWLSPRALFSVLVGFGAAGMLLKFLVTSALWTPIGAVIGGIIFEKFFMRPIWNLLARFASNPARTLSSSVAEEAQAVTNFDAQGNGLVQIELDGQLTQVLGTLREEEKAERVLAGETLLIVAVDEARNRCTVSKIRR